MQDRGALLTGLGIGVGLMYLLDPERGRRRRALVRDQLVRAGHAGGDAMGAAGRDVAHRLSGTTARLRGSLRRDRVDDDVLVERVRAQLGRLVSHPRAIDVLAADGVVTLRGPILEEEVAALLRGAGRVRGVRDVVSELEPHQEPGNVPALQGGVTPTALQPAWRRPWSPTTRLLTGTGALLAAAGVGLAARAATNPDTRRLARG